MSLSGCFGGDDDSNGSSSSDVQSEGTTIVNNYYNYTTINYENNTTSTTTDNSQPSDPTDIDNYYTNQTYDDYNYNNYSYTNNTITNYSSTGPEMIAIGGSAPPRDGRQESANDVVWVLNSSAGEAINIHEAYPQKWEHGNPSSGGGDWPSMRIDSNCNGIVYRTNVGNPHNEWGGDVYNQPEFYLPGSFTFCQHTVYIYSDWTAWSIVYSVNDVTIG
jgi:hypothetical protein